MRPDRVRRFDEAARRTTRDVSEEQARREVLHEQIVPVLIG